MDYPLKNANKFKHQKIAALGDSITNGYNGYYDLSSGTYPEWLSKYLNTTVDNYGVNNASIADQLTDHGDMSDQVQTNIGFKAYDIAIIFYGTNDWSHSSNTLVDIISALQNNLNIIQAKHPKIKLYGILPLRRYDYEKNSDNVKNKGGYTINELCDALKHLYQEMEIPCLDWRTVAPHLITDQNYKHTLQDQHLHPTPATYQKMAKIIGQFMIEHA